MHKNPKLETSKSTLDPSTPNVFAIAQKECVDSFFSKNSFIGYENLHKLGISQPVQFLHVRNILAH